jgi:hypothetical protein
VGELPGPARVGQCPQESLAKQEALELGQALAADQVPVSDLATVAGRGAWMEEWVSAEVDPAARRFRLGASGLAVAVEACRYPMWWRAWRDLEELQVHWAAEEVPEGAGAEAVSRARKRFTQFCVR